MAEKNFDQYVNSGWYKKNPIPANLPGWSGVHCLRMKMVDRLRGLIRSVPKSYPAHILYSTGLNSAQRKKDGFNPIHSNFLQDLNNVFSKDDLVRLCFQYHTKGVRPWFSTNVYPDPNNPKINIVHIDEGGIGLLDRDYYLKSKFKRIRQNYQRYIAHQFSIFGVKNTERVARKVFRIEKEMAKHMLPTTKKRCIDVVNNSFTRRKLFRQRFPWRVYWENLGTRIKKVNIDSPKYYNHLAKMLKTVSMEDWKLYFTWRVINTYGKYASTKMRKEKFRFYGRYMNGTKKELPEWKKITRLVAGFFTNELGKLYVRKYFSAKDKRRVEQIAENIRAAFRTNLHDNVNWLSTRTKNSALRKLRKVKFRVGYPNKWKAVVDHIPLVHKEHSFILNLTNTHRFYYQKQVRKINTKVNRNNWDDTAVYTINAFYEPYTNVITVPAGILQKPMYYSGNTPNDLARNYGSIGRTLGHELTHGFDDEGRKFDGDGKRRDWWTKNDQRRFKQRAKRVIDLYDNIKIVGNHHINGKLTLGENIADLGGIKLAWIAFQRAWHQKYPCLDPNKKIHNKHSPNQLFFTSYARSKNQIYRKKFLIRSLTEDNHSPQFVRINTVLSQFEPFHKVFCVTPEDPMYLPLHNRPHVW
jgi:putative endopeptidase